MTERDMQTLFGKYVQKNPPIGTEAYELKICKGTSIAFDSVQDHQKLALLNAEQDSLFHRITDQPWMPDRPYSFTKKKPFDCFVLVNAKSFVVIWFYKPRKPKIFIKIPIKAYLECQNSCGRKSITEEMAREIGHEVLINIHE